MVDSDSTCEVSSVENDADDEFAGEDVADVDANPKLADALNKVLRMTKKKSKSKSIVLSKAKLYGTRKNVKKDKYSFEIEPNPNSDKSVVKEEEEEEEEEEEGKEEEDIKPDIKDDKTTLRKIGLTKNEMLKRGRIIPHILERERERLLTRIATRGVVQLFNAVRQQQSSVQKQLNENKLTESKKEKILKSVDRSAFMNALTGSVVNVPKIEVKKTEKVEAKDEPMDADDTEKPTWDVLRNDFMMDAKLKDWDKKMEEVEED